MEIVKVLSAPVGWTMYTYGQDEDYKVTLEPNKGALVAVINKQKGNVVFGIYDGTSLLRFCMNGTEWNEMIGDINLESLDGEYEYSPASDCDRERYFIELGNRHVKWNKKENKIEANVNMMYGDFFVKEFKRGDTDCKAMGIFKSESREISKTGIGFTIIHTLCMIDSRWNIEQNVNTYHYDGDLPGSLRPATSAERKLIFDKIQEKGWEWFEKEKTLSKILDRTPVYYLGLNFTLCTCEFRRDREQHRKKEKMGVFFTSQEEAKKYAVEFRRMLKERSLE